MTTSFTQLLSSVILSGGRSALSKVVGNAQLRVSWGSEDPA